MSATVGTIPISSLVNVIPGVLPAGGSQLGLNGLFLTTSTRVPIGAVYSFASAASVGSYFSTASNEYTQSLVYFAGFTGAQSAPTTLLIAQYPTAAVAAYLRGGSLANMTLTQLQALSGVIALTVNGTLYTSSSITLAAASSFSNAATIILAGFTSPPFTVTFDSIASAFVFTDTTTGTGSTITFATADAIVTGLALTAATGAVLSQGANIAVPATFMAALVQVTQNFAFFTTLFNPDGNTGLNVAKLAFQAWNNGQNNRYGYVAWDEDIQATEQANTENMGYILKQTASSGCILAYEPADYSLAAFICGYPASLDFSMQNGRFMAAFRNQSGLVAGVNNLQTAQNLIANGYNFYGIYGNAASNEANLFQPGQISGPFLWIDTYVNQIWLNNNMQIALFNLLQIIGTIPYNGYGRGLIQQALVGDVPGSAGAGPINQAVWYGAIVAGITLSSTQADKITAAAGVNAVAAIQAQGWYLLIGNASAATRSARGSPPITLMYTDGESVQSITLNSVVVL